MISKIRSVVGREAATSRFSLTPAMDPVGGFAIDLDVLQIGALQISARKVKVLRSDDARRLGIIVDTVRQDLGLLSVDEPQPNLTAVPNETHLVLYENAADAVAYRSLATEGSNVAVIAWPALTTLRHPEGITKIERALRKGTIAKCLLIAASGGGPALALAAEWRRLEGAVQRNGMLEIAILREDGGFDFLRGNAAHLHTLDQEHEISVAQPEQDDASGSDPDPW